MEFVEPVLLWGALAVLIPIAIHFWHQKKGQLLPWAATQWLIEKEQQQHRGLRLENLLLLILRCLVILVLVLLLSQPVLDWVNKQSAEQRIHLVEPDAFVVNNFRFELDEALKKGEPVYWINKEAEPINDLTQLPTQAIYSPLTLQAAVNEVRKEGADLHLYVSNDQRLSDVPAIYAPTRFRLHSVADSTKRPVQQYVAVSGKKLFISAANRLTTGTELPRNVRYNATPTFSGSLSVLLDYKSQAEQQTVAAALRALVDVYGLNLEIQLKRNTAKLYDWILTDTEPVSLSTRTLYVISGINREPITTNVVYTEQALTPQTSELVSSGQLPEWLGEQLIRHFGLQTYQLPLSQKQLNALFVPLAQKNAQQQKTVQQLLLLGLIVLIVVERWIALRKNA